MILSIITQIDDFIWTYILIGLLIAAGLYFTLRTGGIQFHIKEMLRVMTERRGKNSNKHISSFQAFAISLATRVGTGNLAGVATAIAIGGPGAIFWMWLIAIIGAATAFIESTLAQLYKERTKNAFIGGPAYYIRKGLKSKPFSYIFAIALTITFGLSYNSVQSNTICDALNTAFNFDKTIVGIILSAISIFIVFGGIHRIAKFSSIIVPIMAGGYILLSLFIICRHIDMIPNVFSLIFENAFGTQQIAGGGLGATILIGIKRGLFSNEAGEGSAPNAAATATTSHPVKQGMIQALGVFTDTLIVCSCTAFIILFSGVDYSGGLNGISLTQAALENEVGKIGVYFIAVAILLFAYSSIIGNYYYGETNIRFITKNKIVLNIFRILSAGVFVIFGAVANLQTVWDMGDLCMAIVTMINLTAILLLSKQVFALLKDYRKQKKSGVKDPIFKRDSSEDFNKLNLNCWE